MNPVEDALIRRLDARRLIADRLNQRERRIFCRYYRYGETYKEVGKQLGITGARVMQVVARGERKLSGRLAPAAQSGFDKSAFLEHMRWLIRRRAEQHEEAKRLSWKAELDVMSHFLKMATPEPPRSRQPAAPPPLPHVEPWFGPLPAAQPQWPVYALSPRVEPWFDPRRTPTQDDIREITKYATGYFAAALNVDRPRTDESPDYLFAVECLRDADAIAGALYPLATTLRSSMRGLSGVRVTSTEDGKSVRIAIETHR